MNPHRLLLMLRRVCQSSSSIVNAEESLSILIDWWVCQSSSSDEFVKPHRLKSLPILIVWWVCQSSSSDEFANPHLSMSLPILICRWVCQSSSFILSAEKSLLIFIAYYTLSGRIGKVVATHAEGWRVDSRLRLHGSRLRLHRLHQFSLFRGYCPRGRGVRPVNWIYRLWRHCP